MWEARIQRILLSFTPAEGFSVSQVAGMEVYAALATLQTWREPKPKGVLSMIDVLSTMGEALLPELDEEAQYGEGVVRQGERRGTMCQ